jgi:hypothetical protein
MTKGQSATILRLCACLRLFIQRDVSTCLRFAVAVLEIIERIMAQAVATLMEGHQLVRETALRGHDLQIKPRDVGREVGDQPTR